MENTINYRGYTINIKQDEWAENPNRFGDEDVCFLTFYHNQFFVEAKTVSKDTVRSIFNNCKDEDGNTDQEAKDIMKKYHCLPLQAYIHSGVSVSLYEGTKQCQWDSSVGGMYFVSKEYAKTRAQARKWALQELKTWNDYLGGDVYYYSIEETGDSCGGYYGYDHEKSGLLDSARAEIDADIEHTRKEHQAKLKIQIKNRVPLNKRLALTF